MNFILDAKGWPDDFRLDRFTAVDVSWKTALRMFARRAEARIEAWSPSLLHVRRPPRLTLGIKSGTLHEVVDLIGRLSGESYAMRPEIEDPVTVACDNVPAAAALERAVAQTGRHVAVRGSAGIYRIVPGTPPPPPPPPTVREMLESLGPAAPSERARAEIAKLVGALESEDLAERDAAQEALAGTGAAAAALLGRAWERAASAELKGRLEAVIRSLWRSVE
jgi:hypothetical protein